MAGETNEPSPPELNAGTDREIDDRPPGLANLLLAEGAGSANPGRRNARAAPSDQEAASWFAHSDLLQGRGGWEPTNAMDADPYLYATSDRQPVMPLEITAALATMPPAPGRYSVKHAQDLEHSGLFDTDQLDPRSPESQQNLMNQPLRIGMGPEQDQAIAKMFDDLKVMSDPGTLNSLGEQSIGDPMSGKEAALRARLDARRRYRTWL